MGACICQEQNSTPWEQNGEDGECHHWQQAIAQNAIAAVEVTGSHIWGVARNIFRHKPKRNGGTDTPAKDDAEVDLPVPLRGARNKLEMTLVQRPTSCTLALIIIT